MSEQNTTFVSEIGRFVKNEITILQSDNGNNHLFHTEE